MAHDNKSQRNAASLPVIIGGAALVVALVGVTVALVIVLNRPAQVITQAPEPQQRAVLVNEDNVEEIAEELVESEPVEMGYYEVNMNMTWNFPDGDSPSTNAYVANVTGNTHDVYFDLLLADTDETIYASPIIPRGGQLSGFKLDTNPGVGSHNCICSYHLVDENQVPVREVNIAVTVVVES
ncbi:MAG: hypothetical protein IJQ81_01705 [Oscillibacter sp.]|nr:hypothetical protein [Oscillibacter sp.]